MRRRGYHPIPTRGYPSAAAAVRAYDTRWPGAPPREVAWMLGLSVREVHLVRSQDRYRALARAHVGRRKDPAEYMRDWRARRAEQAVGRETGAVS